MRCKKIFSDPAAIDGLLLSYPRSLIQYPSVSGDDARRHKPFQLTREHHRQPSLDDHKNSHQEGNSCHRSGNEVPTGMKFSIQLKFLIPFRNTILYSTKNKTNGNTDKHSQQRIQYCDTLLVHNIFSVKVAIHAVHTGFPQNSMTALLKSILPFRSHRLGVFIHHNSAVSGNAHFGDIKSFNLNI